MRLEKQRAERAQEAIKMDGRFIVDNSDPEKQTEMIQVVNKFLKSKDYIKS